nr:response regulator transcription factor [Microvirga puerhi]
MVRRAALLIDNPDLARRIAAMLAQKTEIVILHAPDRPDVLITDHLPSDVPVPTIFLGSQPETFAAREAGVAGILPEDCSATDLVIAMEAVVRGFTIVPQGLADQNVSMADSGDADPSREDGLLTTREVEVLRLLAEGASNKLIARRLGISIHTAKFHVASIAAKLDATGRTDAVAQAIRLKLIML